MNRAASEAGASAWMAATWMVGDIVCLGFARSSLNRDPKLGPNALGFEREATSIP